MDKMLFSLVIVLSLISNWIKLDQIAELGGGGLSPTPILSLNIEKLGLSLYCLKIFKLVLSIHSCLELPELSRCLHQQAPR